MLRLLVLPALALGLSTEARAQGCASESDGPPVSDAASWRQYQSWCLGCGGTVAPTFNAAQAEGGCRLPGGAGQSSEREGEFDSRHDATRQAARLRARSEENAARARRLLAQMIGLGDAPDDASFLGPRGTRPGPRPEPPATLRQPQLQAPAPREQGRPDPEPGPPRPAPLPSGIDGFTRGFEHGNGCYSPNAGPTCNGAASSEAAACLDSYRRGYEQGELASRERLADAYRSGARDRASGRPPTGPAPADANGACHFEAVRAYNAGLGGWPRP